MGEIIGGVLGGLGSLIGGGIQANAADQAAQSAQQGYRYLTSGGGAALNNQDIAGGQTAGNMREQLLGVAPVGDGTSNAFKNYLNSTGYNFQLKSGSDAITGNSAAKGLLNSGGTAKALTAYGQNLGSNYFANYLNQLGGVQTAGENAVTRTANAGAAAGTNAMNAITAGGNAWSNGINGALGNVANIATNYFAQG